MGKSLFLCSHFTILGINGWLIYAKDNIYFSEINVDIYKYTNYIDRRSTRKKFMSTHKRNFKSLILAGLVLAGSATGVAGAEIRAGNNDSKGPLSGIFNQAAPQFITRGAAMHSVVSEKTADGCTIVTIYPADKWSQEGKTTNTRVRSKKAPEGKLLNPSGRISFKVKVCKP